MIQFISENPFNIFYIYLGSFFFVFLLSFPFYEKDKIYKLIFELKQRYSSSMRAWGHGIIINKDNCKIENAVNYSELHSRLIKLENLSTKQINFLAFLNFLKNCFIISFSLFILIFLFYFLLFSIFWCIIF